MGASGPHVLLLHIHAVGVEVGVLPLEEGHIGLAKAVGEVHAHKLRVVEVLLELWKLLGFGITSSVLFIWPLLSALRTQITNKSLFF